MWKLSRSFPDLLQDLLADPRDQTEFGLDNIVRPVTIINSQIDIPVAVGSILWGTPVSAGQQAAPAINTVLADSLALAGGPINLKVSISLQDGLTQQIVALQRRDVANAVTLWERRWYTGTGAGSANGLNLDFEHADTVVAGERLRVIILVAAGAGSLYFADLWAQAR